MVSATSSKPGLLVSAISVVAIITFLFTLPMSSLTMSTTLLERGTLNPYYNDANTIVDLGGEADNASWMSELPDSTRITNISIPGTHDSTARLGGASYVCQTLSLSDQLSMGVRFFDIRLILANGILSCQHGRVSQNLRFTDVLTSMTTFLGQNPSEAVFVKIQQEHTRYSGLDFSSAVQAEISSIPESVLFNASSPITNSTVPLLADLRGKMTIIPRFFTLSTLNTIQYESMTAQDDFTASMLAKATAIIDFYNSMPSHPNVSLGSGDLPVIAGNSTSNSSESVVANYSTSNQQLLVPSNLIEARHQRQRLTLDVDVPQLDLYINYFSLHNNVESPAVAAQSLNPLIANMLSYRTSEWSLKARDLSATSDIGVVVSPGAVTAKSKMTGIVMMDFIGPEAARLIIDSNSDS